MQSDGAAISVAHTTHVTHNIRDTTYATNHSTLGVTQSVFCALLFTAMCHNAKYGELTKCARILTCVSNRVNTGI